MMIIGYSSALFLGDAMLTEKRSPWLWSHIVALEWHFPSV